MGVFFNFLISVPRKYLGRRWAVAMALCFFRRALFLLFKLSKARSLRQRRLYTFSHHPSSTPRTNCESPNRLSTATSLFPLEHFSAIKKRSPWPLSCPFASSPCCATHIFLFLQGLENCEGETLSSATRNYVGAHHLPRRTVSPSIRLRESHPHALSRAELFFRRNWRAGRRNSSSTGEAPTRLLGRDNKQRPGAQPWANKPKQANTVSHVLFFLFYFFFLPALILGKLQRRQFSEFKEEKETPGNGLLSRACER